VLGGVQRAAAEDPPQESGATRRGELCDELHRARTALITATTVRRMGLGEIDTERDEGDVSSWFALLVDLAELAVLVVVPVGNGTHPSMP